MSQAGNRRLTATPGGRFTAGMIRTGDEYRESIRDGREVWINGERVDDVTDPPHVQAASSTSAPASTTWRTRPATRDAMTYVDAATRRACAIGRKLPARRGTTGTPSGAPSTP